MTALRRISLVALLAVCFAGNAVAQGFPNRHLTMVVPFAAGGPTDVLARHLAQAMSATLNQQIIIENVNGAGGTIGTARVAKAQPDGYTLLLMHIGIATAPALYRKLPYDAITDLEPIGRVADVPMTMVATKGLPPNSLKEFLVYAKANKNKLNYANAGVGSSSHLCGLLFMSKIGMDFNSVPYKGNGPAMTDLIGGQVDLMCDQTTNTTQQITSGTVKVYGVTSKSRLPSMPDVPTLDEQGLSGFEVVAWYGLWSPKGTPKAVLESLNHAQQAAIADPTFRSRMADLGAVPAPTAQANPEALRAYLKSEIDSWGAVIKQAGISPE
jgi:tripartite-type tricarboxylate transporter receptor subunit TctC